MLAARVIATLVCAMSLTSAAPAAAHHEGRALAVSARLHHVVRRTSEGRWAAARVSCPARCRVVLSAVQRGRTYSVRRTLPRGRTTIALPDAVVRRLRTGRLVLRVRTERRVLALRRAIVLG